jgi:ribosomal protein S11
MVAVVVVAVTHAASARKAGWKKQNTPYGAQTAAENARKIRIPMNVHPVEVDLAARG